VPDFAQQRARMVERQLRGRGIHDERVLAAMGEVPRELFVSERLQGRAYADSALPIADRQTISQPWIVAAIAQGLELAGAERVLEVGTGSGYSTAVLARLAREVVSIERFERLGREAWVRLAELEIDNVEVRVGDGSRGAPDRAPFTGVAVHATAPGPPATLLGQLEVGGRLVVPIADRRADLLTVFIRTGERLDPDTGAGLERHLIAPARFVPLVGEEGFSEP
jgi:protein-L-isoaspartate(D-aspartate) O-methyltransferase